MSTVALKTMTAEEFFDWVHRPENRDRHFELENCGVQWVWVIAPEARDVSVCRAGHPPRILTEGDELTGDDILPGFRRAVSEFFTLPGRSVGKAT
ncbi:MAG: hypothetical protein ACKV0T_04940 [Planctomycetales bacterium]